MIRAIISAILGICGWEFGKWIYNRRGWELIDRVEKLDSINYSILRSYPKLRIVSKKFGDQMLFEIKGKK